jgi:hypothetical protein
MKIFRAIATVPYSDGTYAEVGMNTRTVFDANSFNALYRSAKEWAQNRNENKFRLEIFNSNNFYASTPLKTEYVTL